MDQFGNGDGAAEFIDYLRGGLCMRGRTYIAHETDVFLYLSGILWSLADRDGRKTGRHGTDGEGTFLGNHGRCRRSCVFPAFKKSGESWGSIPATGMGMFIGGVFISGAVRIWEVPAELDGHAAFYLGVLVILGSAVAYTLFLKGVSLTGPVRASVLACLEPLTAACLSAVWLNSVFTPAELIGFVCILATVLIMK